MKKGFTLIELLAVIVILAITALIATPIVLNIIDDAKKSSILRSADFYIDALKNEIVLENMKLGGSFNPYKCNINNKTILCDGKEINLKVDGEMPTSGTITFEEGKITNVNLIYQSGTIIQNNKGELIFGEPRITLVNYIKKLYKETKTTTVNGIEYSLDETHSLMNDRLGSKDVEKTGGNIRYYGANPNNYIDIGDRDSDGNIIFWRIIGLFKDIEVTNEKGSVIGTEDLVKIIRADKLTSGDVNGFSWDYKSTGAYINNWHDATLQKMLNDETNGYYASGTLNYYNNSTTPTTLNFTSAGLSSEVHNKLVKVKWSLGSHNEFDDYAGDLYRYERIGTNKWSGKIALMYSSDYGYSADLSKCQSTLSKYNLTSCKTTNWLYDSTKTQWTLVSNSSGVTIAFGVDWEGLVHIYYTSREYAVRPVLYLNSNVGIVEEKETSEGLKYFVVE